MADPPELAPPVEFDEAQRLVQAMTYPPVTLSVKLARAFGHRLARPVMARGNQPSRPVALLDGLAVMQRDVQQRDSGPSAEASPAMPEELDSLPPQYEALDDLPAPPERADGEAEARADDPTGRYVMRLADDVAEEAAAEAAWAEDMAEDPETSDVPPETEASEDGADVRELELRARPASNRREDAMQPGQGVAVGVGAEVARGADLLLPLEPLVGPPDPYLFEVRPLAPPAGKKHDRTRRERPQRRGREATAEAEPVEAAPEPVLPEPSREWDLPARFATGRQAVPISRTRLPRQLIPIGAWARNREVLLPERVMLRAAELALLDAAGVDDVEIYRRPVVGVATLAPPFPLAGQAPQTVGPDPLGTLVQYLCKGAQVAALPFGFAPQRFRQLRSAVEQWVRQVDILLLVGGSHHGPRCLGHDVLSSFGEVLFSGMELEPAGDLSVGMVGHTPVLVIPGSLPDVLAGFVLLARPLAHKYFLPQHFLDEVEVSLDHGSQLEFERTTAVPIRYGWDRETGRLRSRYAGQRGGDPWMDCFRGQALAVFPAGQHYADGQAITAAVY